MDDQSSAGPSCPDPVSSLVTRLSGYVADGLRYWEPRRLVYNAVLAIVVAAHFLLAMPGAWEKLTVDLVLGIFVLAVLANVCYGTAYVADVIVQFSGLNHAWRRGRTVLLIVGTSFAAAITHFFAKAIFGG